MKVTMNDGKITLVSAVDYEFVVSLCGWSDDGKGYARSSKLFAGRRLLLHRLIAQRMGLPVEGRHIHHENGDTLDNRRDNLISLSPTDHVVHHNAVREWPVGEAHGNTLVSDRHILSVVEALMMQGGTQREMAEALGVSVPHMGDIVHGRRRPDLQPVIKSLIVKYDWRKGNQTLTDDEVLQIVREYAASGLSMTAFCERDGRISRQHLGNIILGERLPHLQAQVQAILGSYK